MNKLLLLLVLANSYLLNPQIIDEEINMQAKYGYESEPHRNLMQFQKIDYYNVEFTGAGLQGKNYYLLAKEVWDGQVKAIDTLIDISKIGGIPTIQSKKLSMQVFAQRIPDDQLRVSFIFQDFRIEKTFKSTGSFDYSMRPTGSSYSITPSKPFPAFTYLLPYEQEGLKLWCAVDSSGEDVSDWGNSFGLPHYLIFEMKFW